MHFKFLTQKKYDQAVAGFQAYLKSYPKGPVWLRMRIIGKEKFISYKTN